MCFWKVETTTPLKVKQQRLSWPATGTSISNCVLLDPIPVRNGHGRFAPRKESLPTVRQDWRKGHFQLSDTGNLGFLWMEESSSRMLAYPTTALGRYFCGCISVQGFAQRPPSSPWGK